MNYRTKQLLFMACYQRGMRIVEFRLLPGMYKGDNWREEEAAVWRALAALSTDKFGELDTYGHKQVQIGLEQLALEGKVKTGVTFKHAHRMLADLIGT